MLIRPLIAGRPAAVLEEAAVARPGGPQGTASTEQPGYTAGGAQQAECDAEGEVIALCPVVLGGGGGPHGAHQRHQDEGHQAAGKAHVIQVHAVLDLIGIGGQGRHDKTDADAHQAAGQSGPPAVVQGDVADHRGQGGGQQAHWGVLAHGLPAAFGVEKGAQQDGPDVDKVLAEQGEAGHQPHHHRGKAVEGLAGAPQDQGADGGDQGGVDQGGSRSRDEHIVGDQSVLCKDDGGQAAENIDRSVHDQSKQGEEGGVGQEEAVQPLIAGVFCHAVSLHQRAPGASWDAARK